MKKFKKYFKMTLLKLFKVKIKIGDNNYVENNGHK